MKWRTGDKNGRTGPDVEEIKELLRGLYGQCETRKSEAYKLKAFAYSVLNQQDQGHRRERGPCRKGQVDTARGGNSS